MVGEGLNNGKFAFNIRSPRSACRDVFIARSEEQNTITIFGLSCGILLPFHTGKGCTAPSKSRNNESSLQIFVGSCRAGGKDNLSGAWLFEGHDLWGPVP
jgi:hypothetical protein